MILMKTIFDFLIGVFKNWWKFLLGVVVSVIGFNQYHVDEITKYKADLISAKSDVLIEKAKNEQQKILNDVLVKANNEKIERDKTIVETRIVEEVKVKESIEKKTIRDLEKSPSDLAKDFANEFGVTYVKNNEN